MDIQKLKEELTLDEGCEFKLYNDHLGYKTFGVGHLVTKDDPEFEMEIGEEVSEERVNECFIKDIEKVIEDCHILYEYFNELLEDAQLIIANMMFNLGRARLTKFKKMKEAKNLAADSDIIGAITKDEGGALKMAEGFDMSKLKGVDVETLLSKNPALTQLFESFKGLSSGDGIKGGVEGIQSAMMLPLLIQQILGD